MQMLSQLSQRYGYQSPNFQKPDEIASTYDDVKSMLADQKAAREAQAKSAIGADLAQRATAQVDQINAKIKALQDQMLIEQDEAKKAALQANIDQLQQMADQVRAQGQLGSIDPQRALEMQLGSSYKRTTDWDQASQIGNQIDELYSNNLDIMRKYPDGQIPEEIQSVYTSNLAKITSLSNQYKGITNGKDYKSVNMDAYRAMALMRKDSAQAEQAEAMAIKQNVDMNLALGDRYDAIVKEAVNFVQESQYAQDARTLATLAKQVAAIKASNPDYKSNPAFVRALLVAFNKMLEPGSAVMSDDFKSSAGISDDSVAKSAVEIAKMIAVVKSLTSSTPDPSTTPENSPLYILNPDQVAKVENAYNAAKSIVPTLQNNLWSAGATELMSRLANPHYNKAGLSQLTKDQAVDLMRRTSGVDLGGTSAATIAGLPKQNPLEKLNAQNAQSPAMTTTTPPPVPSQVAPRPKDKKMSVNEAKQKLEREKAARDKEKQPNANAGKNPYPAGSIKAQVWERTHK